MERDPLTPKEKGILRFVRSFVRQNGWPPSMKEIARQFGWNSHGTVDYHLKRMAEKGYVTRTSQARSIRVL